MERQDYRRTGRAPRCRDVLCSFYQRLSTSSALQPTIMFKGMLSSKRIASSDFTMVTNLSDEASKENAQPATAALPIAAKLGKPAPGIGKGLVKGHYRKRTADSQSHKPEVPPQPAPGMEMNFAFDQLLVCTSSLPRASPHIAHASL